jgi:prepilin-type N-terminal cleavage/methylation domain-containing protein
MKILNSKYKTINPKDGFTIVELLIALAISAMLMTAIAVAFNGSVINYQQNEDIYKTVNNARQALFRMTTQLRTANDLNTITTQMVRFPTAENEDITYEFADGKLYLITNADNKQYVLCENVTGSFTTILSGTVIKGVQINMTVQNGDTHKTLTAATVFRKSL